MKDLQEERNRDNQRASVVDVIITSGERQMGVCSIKHSVFRYFVLMLINLTSKIRFPISFPKLRFV